jgi:hypothetical protein
LILPCLTANFTQVGVLHEWAEGRCGMIYFVGFVVSLEFNNNNNNNNKPLLLKKAIIKRSAKSDLAEECKRNVGQ